MLASRPQTRRSIEHDQHHRQPEEQHPQRLRGNQFLSENRELGGLGHIAKDLRNRIKKNGPQDHAGYMAHAAEHHHRDDHHRLHEGEALGRHETLEGREHRAGHTAERRPHCKGEQLDIAGIDAHRLGGDLVLADRHPGASEPGILQPNGDDDDDDRQDQEQVVVQIDRRDLDVEEGLGLAQAYPGDLDRVDIGDALRAVGDIDRRVQVVQEDSDDFAEAECHDGQIVAAQPQGRCTEQSTEQRRKARSQRYDQPDRVVQPIRKHLPDELEVFGELRRRQQCVEIGSHRIEGHVAEIEQSGIADHDVQSERQHHVEQREVDDAHPAIALGARHKRQCQQYQRDDRGGAISGHRVVLE